MSLVLFVGAWALGTWQRIYEETPGVEEFLQYKPAETSVIYDRTGQHQLYQLHANEDRKVLAHNEISDKVRLAILAAEDNNFYHHRGFDIKGIMRALWRNLEENRYEQGASTITQQLARNIFLTQEQTLTRKTKELAIAIKIEKQFTKDEILDFYLNQISYGADIYGVEAAAQNFFRKSASELNLNEAATLAALPKATSYYSPYGANKDKLVERRNYILDKMVELGWSDQAEVKKVKRQPIEVYLPKNPIEAPHFVFYVFEQLKKNYGEEMVRNGGFNIYTSLDYDLQKQAEQVVREGANLNQAQRGGENAAMVILDPRTGQVLAMVGSKDYFAGDIDGEVNVAVQLRQPGSAFKPIAYAKAFESGISANDLLYDVKTDFGPDGSGKNYMPNNYDRRFHGLVSLRSALAMSLNIPAVKALYLAGVPETIELAERLGITTLTRKDIYGLSLVLGGGEVNLLELTGAFGTFANDGKHAEIAPILKIVSNQGEVIEEVVPRSKQVVAPPVAREVNSVLSDNNARKPVFGPNSDLFVAGHQVAAKTGTTQEYRDAWTIGYTPEIAIGVWAGNNDNRPMKHGASGISTAAPIWHKMMSQVLAERNLQAQFIPFNEAEKNGQLLQGENWDSDLSVEEVEKIFSIQAKAKDKKQSLKKKKVHKRTPLEFSERFKNDPMVKRWQKTAKHKKHSKKDKKDKKKKHKKHKKKHKKD